MAETVEAPKFDAAAYLEERNKQAEAAKTGQVQAKVVPEKESVKEAPKAEEPPAEDREKRISRSDRRRARQFEELGYLRGKVETLENLMANGKVAAPEKGEDDPEPIRTAYSSDHDYQRALGRWDARQEANKAVAQVTESQTQREQREQWESHLRQMDVKAAEDIKTIKDWDEVAKAAAEDEDAPEWTAEDHPTLMGLIHSSDEKAFVLYHFAKHPEDLQKLLDLTPNPGEQIRQFARLEGRIEKMYTSTEPDSKAAQAKDESPKDRTHPAEAQAGRNSAERDASKPKPSSEASARGGSAPPEEPLPGSKAWMERRNQATGGR